MQRRVIIYIAVALLSLGQSLVLHTLHTQKKSKMVLVLIRLQPKSNIKQNASVGYNSEEDTERLLIAIRGSNFSI